MVPEEAKAETGAAAPRSRAVQFAEYLTLGAAAGGVVLFTVGRVSRIQELGEMSVHGVEFDTQWQEFVFSGGLAVINTVASGVASPHLTALPWMLGLLFLAVSWRLLPRVPDRGALRWLRPPLIAALVISFLATVLGLGLDWGKTLARELRPRAAITDHLTFQPGVAATLPPALLEENEKGTLLLVGRNPEVVVLVSKVSGKAWQLASAAVLSVESHVGAPASQARASTGTGGAGARSVPQVP